MKLAKASGTRSCGTKESVGFSPYTPVQAAGSRVEHPASVASAMGVSPAATDTAAPAEEPPQVSSGVHGLRVRPVNGELARGEWANSVVVVLPMMMAPAARRRATASTSAFAGFASAVSSDP